MTTGLSHHGVRAMPPYLHRLSSVLPPSPREYPIRGLNLIRLLTQNRIADFHTTLESLPLPADSLTANPYIAHPINLEQLQQGVERARRGACRGVQVLRRQSHGHNPVCPFGRRDRKTR